MKFDFFKILFFIQLKKKENLKLLKLKQEL